MFHRPGLLPPMCQQDGRTHLRRAALREASWRPRAPRPRQVPQTRPHSTLAPALALGRGEDRGPRTVSAKGGRRGHTLKATGL